MNLARIRQSRKLSQRDLADMIGMDPATVQRAETEHPSAKLATYKLCAEALGVPLAALFSDQLTDDEIQALQMYRAVPAERRHVLRDLFLMAQGSAGPKGQENE